jgi:hypothetical protein
MRCREKSNWRRERGLARSWGQPLVPHFVRDRTPCVQLCSAKLSNPCSSYALGFESLVGQREISANYFVGFSLQEIGGERGIRTPGTLLANVHVGGIPRSTDGGATWNPTIEIDEDVHEVRAHVARPDIVIAAAATGLCISRDGGATWSIEQKGLHAHYCSAVAFAGTDVLVAASEDHFAARGGVYRRSLDEPGPLLPVGGGLPQWLDGIVDTACIAAHASTLALADRGGNVYRSKDTGQTWSRIAERLATPSSVFIV